MMIFIYEHHYSSLQRSPEMTYINNDKFSANANAPANSRVWMQYFRAVIIIQSVNLECLVDEHLVTVRAGDCSFVTIVLSVIRQVAPLKSRTAFIFAPDRLHWTVSLVILRHRQTSHQNHTIGSFYSYTFCSLDLPRLI